MLALYLCSGVPLASLPGLDQVCGELGINSVPKAKGRLGGHSLQPSKTDTKPDGTEVHTLG